MSRFLALIVVSICVTSTLSFLMPSALATRSRSTATTTRMSATSTDTDEYQQVIEMLRAKMADNPMGGQLKDMMATFLDDYSRSNRDAKYPPEQFKANIFTFFKTIGEAIQSPYQFQPHHSAIREPFDYYNFGNSFLEPLIIADQSRLIGVENAVKIREFIAEGENVVIMSNHQTEADPQVLSILLAKEGLGDLAEQIIFVAGHKVTTDPIAIPFSMGRNLLCIHSKKHIKNPPEDISRKQAENMATMSAMSTLLSRPKTEPGAVFWVAPSGGRDRPDPEKGGYVVAEFDAKALDMFKLQAMQSKKPMHFFPMAMYTHQLVPPPKDLSSGTGEERSAKRGAVSVEFLPETDGLGGLKDKEFAGALMASVSKGYADLTAWHISNGSHGQ